MAGEKVKAKKKSTNVVLSDISAIQVILAGYAADLGSKIIDMAGDDGDLPQTYIQDDENIDRDIPISEILHEKSKRSLYFLDSRKIPNKMWGTMIDVTSNGCLPLSVQKPCWWCRHNFQTRPIGCPIRYNPHKSTGIEKERFEEKTKAAGLDCETNDFFETEGYFCSFPCCKAYILDQQGNSKYKDSATLLTLLYLKIYGSSPTFPCAPTWKILKDYGGHLNISEFRSSFGRLEYEPTVNTRRPYMYSSSQYISEKKIKLFKGVKES
jgi:hypothetical protein